jgi:hypothetical protein
MEDMRLSNTARYPDGTSFTPPTASLVNDDNTQFLIHGHGTSGSTDFFDDNGVGRSAVGLIADDNAQVDTAQSQFGGTSAEFPSTAGWLQTGAVDAFAVSGDWTKEFWVYYNKSDADQYIHHNRGGYSSGSFNVYTPSSGNVRANFNDGGTTRTINTTFSTGQWYHYAFVNNSGTITWYVDGSSVGTASWSSTINDPDKTLRWGGFSAGGSTDKFEGWIDEYRFSNTARYTSGFTPSTTPFVNDSNTLLLLHMDGTDGSTDFRDDNGTGRSAIGITGIGNAQIDTAQSQFGGSSLLLDGTGDWLKHNDDNGTFQFGSNDFTIEAWINPSAINTSGSPMEPIWNKYNTSNSQRMLSFGIYDGFLGYFWASSGASGNAVQTTQAISTGSWKHVALCREGNTWNTYYDGTRVDTRTLAVTLHASTEPVYIGSYFGTVNNEINGYIDELRVSDNARYTGASYTVPTEPFQNDANTILLLHMNGTDGSTTFIDDNGVTTAGQGA